MSKKVKRPKRSAQEEFNEMDQISEFKINQAKNLEFKINTKFKNKKQKEMFDMILENRITFVSGSAGTGKSLIALMAGLECVKNKDINIDQIILTKPILEITSSGHSQIGSLKGTLEEKTQSYYTSFYDNLIKIIGNEAVKYLKYNNVIKESVLNYLRGTTFGRYNNFGEPVGSYAIADEFQNTTVSEMLTFISRMGEESKLVILGDTNQSDLRLTNGTKNGLTDAIDRLQNIDKIGFIKFTSDDIVRDPFLTEIIKRYEKK